MNSLRDNIKDAIRECQCVKDYLTDEDVYVIADAVFDAFGVLSKDQDLVVGDDYKLRLCLVRRSDD